MAGNDASTLLGMADIVKRFPGVVALGGVDLDVRPGEVHCLLGQNGAGKSTLIKVLAGVHQPDEGTITWQGEEVRLHHPQAAMDLGIATIYQELDLVEGLSVAENIYLGHEKSRFGFSQRRASAKAAAGLLKRLGHPEISPSAEVGSLSAAGQQIVSMARALSHDTKLIIMDEPSAVLDAGEVERLFHVIRDLTAEGVAVVYISHRLEEIRTIGDRVTVLKDGKTVATGLPAKETPTSEVIRLMTGRSIEYVFPPRGTVAGCRAPPARRGPVPPRRVPRRQLHRASGRGARPRRPRRRRPLGDRRDRVRRPQERRRHASTSTGSGCARARCSPPSARASGSPRRSARARRCSSATASRRTSRSPASPASRASGYLDRSGERRAAVDQVESLDVRPTGVDREMRTLSGGNQQKVVLARWLLRGCRVLILDEPTRGVDVGARSEIYALVRRLADDGVAVVVVSSEIEEVLGLSDRVLVVGEGSVLHEAPADQLDEHQVLDIIMRGDAA